MNLFKSVSQAIWDEYKSYRDAEIYLKQWHEHDDFNYENFTISRKGGSIDVFTTISTMDDETLLKVAIDIGVETPDFIPSIPQFRNELKSNFKNASAAFERAFKQIEEHPDVAIGLANSALEGIIKELLRDDRIKEQVKSTGTLYSLTQELIKVLDVVSDKKIPPEIKTIGRSLLAVNQSIEKIRSEKTAMHGKASNDYIVEDPMYTYFIVNSVATVGLFLNSYFKLILPKPELPIVDPLDDLPF